MNNTTDCISHSKKLFNIKAEKLYREACELFYLKNYEQSLSLLKETIRLDKFHTKAFLLMGDIKLLSEGNEAEALSAYDKAIRSNPTSTQALGSKAYVLDILGRHKEALESCNKAFEHINYNDNDQLSSLFDQKISILCSLENFDDAQKTLDEALNVLSEEHAEYLKSCYLQKIAFNKQKNEKQLDLKLLF